MKKTVFVALALCVLMVAACGKKTDSADQDTGDALVFWQTMAEHEQGVFNEIVDRFREENPDIKIVIQYQPFDKAQENFINAANGGNAPDVLRCEIAWTPLFADGGLLIPIEQYIPQDELKDYLDAPLNYNLFQGRLWGLPQVTDCLALMYNKRILTEAGLAVPATMEDLLKVAAALTDAGNNKYGIFMPADAYFAQSFIWAFGGGLISDDKQILVNNDASVAGLEFFFKVKDAAMPETVAINTQMQEMEIGFRTGKYAMIIQGPWATSKILEGPEFVNDHNNLGIAVIPKGPAGYGSPVGGHNYVISKDCERVEDAVTFIRFLNRTENQVLMATKLNLLPTRISAYDDPSIQKNHILQGFKKQLDVATNRPVIPEGGRIYPDFIRYVQEAFEGKISPRNALDQTAKVWQGMLK